MGDRAAPLDAELERLKARLAKAEDEERPLVERLESARQDQTVAQAGLEASIAARREAAAEQTAWSARVDALAQALDAARARAGAEHLSEVRGRPRDPARPGRDRRGLGAGRGGGAWARPWPRSWWPMGQPLGGPSSTCTTPVSAGACWRPVDQRLRPTPASPGFVSVTGCAAADPGVARLLDRLLHAAVAVEGTWSDALDAAVAHPTAVVVTKAGDRFSATGFRLGLGGAGATASALDEARRRSAAADDALARREAEVAQATAQAEAAGALVAQSTARLDAHDAEVGGAADALARMRRDRYDLAQALEAARLDQATLARRHQQDASRLAELERVLIELEADEASEVDAARRRNEVRARREEEARDLARRRRDLAVRSAGIEERSSLLEQRLADVERRLAEGTAAQADATARIELIERSAVAVERLAVLVERHRQVVEVRLARLHEERQRQTDEARAASGRLDELRRARSDAERRLAELAERQRRCEIGDAETRTRLEAAVEAVRRDLDTEPAVAMAAEQPPLPDGVTPAARVRDLEREVRLMGPINPLALEEFTALQERHTFLEAQLEDVRNSRRELQRVIRSVDAEIQSVFAAAFADVSDSFTSLFAMLFPGGSGRLVLTDPDDLLSTGIEVEAEADRARTSRSSRCSRVASDPSPPWPSCSRCSAAAPRRST